MARTPARRASPAPAGPHGPRLYTLEVFIISGPITEAFARKNPEISRVIRVRGDQTLEDLHDAIFDAFGRDDAHMYEFQFGHGPMDPKGPRYVLPTVAGDDDGPPVAGTVDRTTLDALGLKAGDRFGYWFDFGDDWWHQINVEAVADEIPPGKYPEVVSRVGESPPQYVDWDAEEPAPPKPRAKRAPAKKGGKPKAGKKAATGDDAGPVPAAVKPVFDAITALTDKFCRERLTDEYTAMCRKLAGVLARKRPSPLVKGKPESWAAGIVRAIGMTNFLHDPGQTPHVKSAEIDAAFGVSEATGQAKSKAIRDLLDMSAFDPAWTVPAMMDQNPLAWLISVNGFMLDARHAPREVQEEALRKGLIPYLPPPKAGG